jgi:hypothetical protein
VKEPQGCCVYCTYEIEPRSKNHITEVRRATVVVETTNGPRDLCEAHAVPGNKPASVKFRRQ